MMVASETKAGSRVGRAGVLRVAAWAVAALAAGWRCFELGARGLWFDEAFSWRLTRFGWSEMIARAAADVHPPLYYVVLKAWTATAGDSVLAIRSLSVAWFALALFAAVGICAEARRARGERGGSGPGDAGPIAILLLSTNPLLFRYSQEARMYAQEIALALGSTWLLLRALRREDRPVRSWSAYGLSASALAYTHNYGLLTVASQAAFALGWTAATARARGRHPWRNPATSGLFGALLLAAALYLPWAPTLSRQGGQVRDDYWAKAVGEHSPLDSRHWQWVLLHSFALDRADQISPSAREEDADLVIALALAGAAVWVIAALVRRGDGPGWCLAAGVVGPPALAVLASFAVSRTLIEARFLLPSTATLLVGAAVVLGSIPRPSVRWYLALAAAANMAYCTWSYRDSLGNPPRAEFAEAADQVAADWRAGDLVLASSPADFFPLLYHARGRFEVRQARHATLDIRHYSGGPIFAPGDFLDWEGVAVRQDGRLWLVGTRSGNDALPKPREWRRTRDLAFDEAIRWRAEIHVELWEPRPDGGPPP